MSDLFWDVASIDYPILDADAHVNEPPDTWQTRVPHKLRNRAPKVLHTEHGDVWSGVWRERTVGDGEGDRQGQQ